MSIEMAIEAEQQTPADEPTIHLARCADCDYAVRYQPSSSGAGFTLIDSDAALGIGESGRPICPNGHGEMGLADDRLPAADAIEQAAEQVEAEKQKLPFPAPPFNYEGTLHALFEKRHEIGKLEKKFNDRKELLKEAREDLEAANTQLGKMLDEFEQHEQDRLHEIARRQADAERPADAPRLVRCTWEQAHPDEPCPVCSNMTPTAAPDSAAHMDEVEATLDLRDVVAVCEALSEVNIIVGPAIIDTWTREERDAVRAWAGLATRGDDGSVNPLPDRPAILGTAHIASNHTVSEAAGETFQECRECGARLVSVATGSGEQLDPYPAGTLVGTDCAGAKQLARYPKRGRKKKQN
jgi:hypothetical protein